MNELLIKVIILFVSSLMEKPDSLFFNELFLKKAIETAKELHQDEELTSYEKKEDLRSMVDEEIPQIEAHIANLIVELAVAIARN